MLNNVTWSNRALDQNTTSTWSRTRICTSELWLNAKRQWPKRLANWRTNSKGRIIISRSRASTQLITKKSILYLQTDGSIYITWFSVFGFKPAFGGPQQQPKNDGFAFKAPNVPQQAAPSPFTFAPQQAPQFNFGPVHPFGNPAQEPQPQPFSWNFNNNGNGNDGSPFGSFKFK